MSWAGGPRSQSGNRLQRPASGLDFFKEDDGEKLINGKEIASGHDAGTNGATTNGTVNGAAANEPAKTLPLDGHATLERINFDT